MTSFPRSLANVFSVLLCVAVCGTVRSQGPCGGKPCPVVRSGGSRARTPRAPVQRQANPSTGGRAPAVPKSESVCGDADLTVVCGMPDCLITLNGKDSSVTDELGGITFQVAGNKYYKVRVTKPGYENFESEERGISCADEREVKVSLRAKPVTVRIRTKPGACDIYIDGKKQPSGSNVEGVFSYTLTNPTMLVEARRKGYLSATKNVFLAPELANRETLLELEPISATVTLSVNIEDASVTIDDQRPSKPAGERILLAPGLHTLSVDALGYVTEKIVLRVGPDEVVKRQVMLLRLPVPLLQEQAVGAIKDRRFADALKLCNYIFDVDPANPVAHGLEGQVYVERGDFNNALAHFALALSGGEVVTLKVRRHMGEKFDLSKGHDMCEGRLILGRETVEFRGDRIATEDFKVSIGQIQVIGIQLRKSVASYLGTKVMIGGKKRDFNFYSYDKELSQEGKAYLQMIQNLLVPH